MHGWGFSMRLLTTIVLMMSLVQASVAAADGMVDPTKPPAPVMAYLPNTQAQIERPWELTALQDNGKNGFAVVNGQMVQVGNSYEGFKLSSVKNQQAVFISKLGEKKVLRMGLSSFMEPVQPPAGIKKTAKKIKRTKIEK